MVGFSFTLDLMTLGFVIVAGMLDFLLIFWLGNYWWDIRNNYPEIHAHKAAKEKSHPPVIDLVDNSGRHFIFSGEKEKNHSLTLKNEDYGLMLDPALSSKMPADHFLDGTRVLSYGTTFHFPVDHLGARGVIQMVRKIRELYPKLAFIRDDFVLLELLQKSATDLPDDIKVVLENYKQDAFNEEILDKDEFVKMIEEIKKKLKEWKLESGFYTLAEAISKLPFGMMAVDVKRAVNLAKAEERNDNQQKDADMWKYLIMALCVIGAIVVSWMVITSMAPKTQVITAAAAQSIMTMVRMI